MRVPRGRAATAIARPRAGTAVFVLLAAAAASASPLDLLKPASEPRRVTVRLVSETEPIVPGTPFTVRAEVTPQPNIRVYGPGNTDYTPVTLRLDWPAGTRAGEPRYPAPEPYLFGDAKELVHVYSGPFRITQQVTLPRGTRPTSSDTLVVTGSLRYQACTDRVCFPVETLPVELSLRMGGAKAGPGS